MFIRWYFEFCDEHSISWGESLKTRDEITRIKWNL